MKHGSSWSVFLSAASYCIWQVEISYPTSLPRNPIDQYHSEVSCVFFILNFTIPNTVIGNFGRGKQRIGEGVQIPDSLVEEAFFINVCISKGCGYPIYQDCRFLPCLVLRIGNRLVYWLYRLDLYCSYILQDGFYGLIPFQKVNYINP